MSNREEGSDFPRSEDVKLSAEGSIEYGKSLLGAFVLRSQELRTASTPMSIEEREAWKLLIEPIDLAAVGPAADAIRSTLEQIDSLNRFQAQVELGHIAGLEP